MYGLKLYENYFKYLTSLNKNLINIYFVSIFSTNSAGNQKKKMKESLIFFYFTTNFYYGFFILRSNYAYILIGSKGLSQFFLDPEGSSIMDVSDTF